MKMVAKLVSFLIALFAWTLPESHSCWLPLSRQFSNHVSNKQNLVSESPTTLFVLRFYFNMYSVGSTSRTWRVLGPLQKMESFWGEPGRVQWKRHLWISDVALFFTFPFLDLLQLYLQNLSYLSISCSEFEGDFKKSKYWILLWELFYKFTIRKSQGLAWVSKNNEITWHHSHMSILVALTFIPGAGCMASISKPS